MKSNQQIINEYLNFKKDTEKSLEQTLKTDKSILKTLDNSLNGKPFQKATEPNIIKFLNRFANTTRDDRLRKLKKFYRWLLELEEGEKLPECIKRIKPSKKNPLDNYNDTEYRERVITETEYQKLIDYAANPKHKAIIETLFLFGIRRGELTSMNATNAQYNGENTKITVRNSKKIARDIIHRGRAEHLLKYAETYQPYKGERSKPLWVNQSNKRYTGDGILQMLVRTAERAEIRKITAHDFRHTAVTNARKNGIPITHIETNYGFAHGSQMMRVYDHNKTKDFEEYLAKKGDETPATNETLKKQKETLEQKHGIDIKNLELEQKELKTIVDKLSNKIAGYTNPTLKNVENPAQLDIEEKYIAPNKKQFIYWDVQIHDYILYGEPFEVTKYGFPKEHEEKKYYETQMKLHEYLKSKQKSP